VVRLEPGEQQALVFACEIGMSPTREQATCARLGLISPPFFYVTGTRTGTRVVLAPAELVVARPAGLQDGKPGDGAQWH
jgi:hypothetical protein